MSSASVKPPKTSGKPRSSTNGSSAGNARSASSTGSSAAQGATQRATQMAKPKQSPRNRRAAAARELTQELEVMRRALHEMTQRYQLRVGGQIEDLMEILNGDAALDQPPRLPTLKRIAALEQVLADLKIKPKKGRARDFHRLEKTVASLRAVLEE